VGLLHCLPPSLVIISHSFQFEELVDQFIPSDPTWKGWVKMAFQQPLIPVLPVARELFSKTKLIARKGGHMLDHAHPSGLAKHLAPSYHDSSTLGSKSAGPSASNSPTSEEHDTTPRMVVPADADTTKKSSLERLRDPVERPQSRNKVFRLFHRHRSSGDHSETVCNLQNI
jgi:hypothetical protein